MSNILVIGMRFRSFYNWKNYAIILEKCDSLNREFVTGHCHIKKKKNKIK